jgi:hypothetical protein
MAQFAPQYNLFVIIDKIRTGITYIFWIIFLLSTIPAILKMLEIDLSIDDLLNTMNIICISLFFVLEIVVEYILVPQADSKRRDDFIDNAFGSTFSTNASIGYFDTDEIQPGLYKAATNLFENSFFTYSLVKAITVRKTVLPALVLLSIAVFAYYGFKQVPFGLSLLQALFSATLLGELVKHFILMVRLHDIHDSWITLFQYQDFKSDTDKYKTLIYRYWLQYETLHSRIQANIPDKVFNKLNSKLTQEWNSIKTRYKIN